jgi:glycosyltransferase involved in cell wall biosynthesis
VLPTGINLETFLRADGTSLRAEKGWEDKTVLISVGRLAPEKNWDTLLHAFAKLRIEHPSVHLVLIGEGTARQSLQALAIERGINDRVTFTGALPFEEIPRYLKAADIFAFASITETQGLATIEAMAAGLPIVAVDGPGTRDFVEHGRQGLLVENDPNALAKGLNELLTDPQRMKRLSQNALKKARIFGITRLGKKLVRVYEQAIQDKRENQYVTLEK